MTIPTNIDNGLIAIAAIAIFFGLMLIFDRKDPWGEFEAEREDGRKTKAENERLDRENRAKQARNLAENLDETIEIIKP